MSKASCKTNYPSLIGLYLLYSTVPTLPEQPQQYRDNSNYFCLPALIFLRIVLSSFFPSSLEALCFSIWFNNRTYSFLIKQHGVHFLSMLSVYYCLLIIILNHSVKQSVVVSRLMIEVAFFNLYNKKHLNLFLLEISPSSALQLNSRRTEVMTK